jgi:hypothetical protein
LEKASCVMNLARPPSNLRTAGKCELASSLQSWARAFFRLRPGQDSQDRTPRTGQAKQDSQNRTARTGQPEKDSQNRTARTGHSQNRAARTGQAEQDCLDRIARTGQPGHERQDRTGRSMTGRTGKAEQDGQPE